MSSEAAPPATPRWERGHRAHGYWLGTARIGFVSRPVGAKTGDPYSWEVEANGVMWEAGVETTLRKAKRAVERAWLRAAARGFRPGGTTRPSW